MENIVFLVILSGLLLTRVSLVDSQNGTTTAQPPRNQTNPQNATEPKPSGTHSLQDESISKAMGKLSPNERQRLLQGGRNAFQNMTKEMIKSLSASVFAAVGKEAIRSMNREQLKEMTRNMKQGTNSKDIEKILEDVDESQFNNMLDDLQNSTQKLTRKQMEAFTKQMKTNKGSPSTWTANTVKQLGTMVKGLSPKELKELANAGAATFEASLEVIAKGDVKELSKGQRREIVDGAVKSFGSQSTWDATAVKKMSKFVGSMKHKDIQDIPATALLTPIPMKQD